MINFKFSVKIKQFGNSNNKAASITIKSKTYLNAKFIKNVKNLFIIVKKTFISNSFTEYIFSNNRFKQFTVLKLYFKQNKVSNRFLLSYKLMIKQIHQRLN